jgi:hypothetical protein
MNKGDGRAPGPLGGAEHARQHAIHEQCVWCKAVAGREEVAGGVPVKLQQRGQRIGAKGLTVVDLRSDVVAEECTACSVDLLSLHFVGKDMDHVAATKERVGKSEDRWQVASTVPGRDNEP